MAVTLIQTETLYTYLVQANSRTEAIRVGIAHAYNQLGHLTPRLHNILPYFEVDDEGQTWQVEITVDRNPETPETS